MSDHRNKNSKKDFIILVIILIFISILTSFSEDLGFDSLDDVELIMNVENEFDICIPDHMAEEVKTIKDAYELLGDLLN